MTKIIEMEDNKHLAEYAEKVIKYGKKLLECLEEEEAYSERYGRKPYGFRHEDEEDRRRRDYVRYY
jgi:hypothetical protein